jgi:hypothetical protein
MVPIGFPFSWIRARRAPTWFGAEAEWRSEEVRIIAKMGRPFTQHLARSIPFEIGQLCARKNFKMDLPFAEFAGGRKACATTQQAWVRPASFEILKYDI